MTTPNYREAQIQATGWRRATQVWIDNPLAGIPTITFEEEDVMITGANTVKLPAGSLPAVFEPAATFPLLNPETGEALGATASHQELYVLLHSLYMHLARLRDAAAPAGGQ